MILAQAQAGVWGQSQDTYQGFVKNKTKKPTKKKKNPVTKGAKKTTERINVCFLNAQL